MTSAIMDGLLPAILDLGVRGALLLASAGLLTLAARRRSAALRHLIWALAIGGLLALPALRAVTPDVRVDLPVPARLAGVVAGPAASSDAGPAAPGTTSPAETTRGPGIERAAAVAPLEPATSAYGGDAAVSAPAVSAPAAPSPAALLTLAWLAGVLVLLAPVLVGWVGVGRLARRSRRLESSEIRHRATRLALRVGVTRPFALVEGIEGRMPMTFGLTRPVIMLPPEAVEWPEARLDAVLLHELAHVGRRDTLTQLLAELARAVHWFNPLVWVAVRRLRVEREHACDDIALAGGARPSDYADELLGLARSFRTGPGTGRVALAMARPSQLSDRLLAVLDETRSRGDLGRIATVPALGLALALILPLAAMTPAQADARPTAPAAAEVDVAELDITVPDAPPVPARQPPTPDVSPPSPLSRSAAQEATCAAASGEWRSVSHQSNNERVTIRMQRAGCELEARLEGDVRLDAAGIGVAHLGRGARIRLEEDDGRQVRYLEIHPGRDGRPEFDFRVNRRSHEFDSAAQAWYRAFLLQLFRNTGWFAEQRVDALLESGGVEAVFREMGRIDSGHAYARYAEMLLERARLDEAQIRALVRSTASRGDSDYGLASVLGAVAESQQLTGGLLDDYIQASLSLESDHYRAEALRRVLGSGQLSDAQVGAVLRAAGRMDSDHYRAEILRQVGQRELEDATLHAAFFRVAAGLDSDHYYSQTMDVLLGERIGGELLIEVIRSAARQVDSDHYLSELLLRILDEHAVDGPVRSALLEAMDTLDSTHYRGRVADALLRAERR